MKKTTRKKSSVSGCECQMNGPFNFATIRSCPLNWPITHPTLGNSYIAAVATGFQFVVAGNIIATLTKDGITYGP